MRNLCRECDLLFTLYTEASTGMRIRTEGNPDNGNQIALNMKELELQSGM